MGGSQGICCKAYASQGTIRTARTRTQKEKYMSGEEQSIYRAYANTGAPLLSPDIRQTEDGIAQNAIGARSVKC